MNRKVRRSLAVVLGLGLGWSAAGFLPGALTEPHPSLAATEPAVAQESGHDPHAASPAAPNHKALHAAAGGHAQPRGEGAEAEHAHDPGLVAAEALVPAPGETPWLRPVLLAAGGLFVAAVVLGIPALRLRGPLPPDPAEALAHDDGTHAEDKGGGAHTHGPHGSHPEPVTSVTQAHGGH